MNKHQNVECKICNKEFPTLATHLIRTHGVKPKEYLKRYPKAEITSAFYRNKVSESAKKRFKSDPTLKIKVASRTFDFIKNKKIAQLLQRDYKSAKACLNHLLWKPSIILYGSIIEAVLIEKHPSSKTFYEAIENAFKNKTISENEYHKISLIRNLRNFVHLHKELEENQEINEYWAKTFADICESIIKRLRQKI